MQVTTDELLQLLGAKEAELFLLRRHAALLEARLARMAEESCGPVDD